MVPTHNFLIAMAWVTTFFLREDSKNFPLIKNPNFLKELFKKKVIRLELITKAIVISFLFMLLS